MPASVPLPTDHRVAEEFKNAAASYLGLIPHEEDDPSARAYSTDFVSLRFVLGIDYGTDDSWA